MSIVAFVIGCFWITMGLITTSKNLLSKLLFKVIPFFSGVYVCFYSALAMGWIK